MNKFTTFAIVAAIVATAGAVNAQTRVLIDGFEGTTGLINSSPGSQSANRNIGNATAQMNTDTAFITQGTKSSKVDMTWNVTGSATAPVAMADAYERDNPNQLHWSMRGHYATAPTISKSYSGLELDVYNNSNYAVNAAIMINDGAYKHNPWQSLAPKAWTKLSWNFAADDASLSPAVTGNAYAPLVQANTWKFYGVALHTTTEPGDAGVFQMYVDNLVGVSAQTDTTPPLPPQILSATQGSAAGKLKVKWAVTTDPDDAVAFYTIKMYKAAAFGSNNRINFAQVAKTVQVTGAAATEGEVDLDSEDFGKPVYVSVTATDSATPVANESNITGLLGAVLASDGSAAKDTVVFDMKRYPSSDINAVTYGYPTVGAMIPYYAKAWAAWTDGARTMESQIADAALPAAKTDGVVVYVNAMDGNTTETAISEANATKLNNFVAGNGKLFITGSRFALGLSQATGTAQTALFANTLKLASVTDAAGSQVVVNGTTAYTAADIWYYAPGYSNNNVALTPNGANAAGNIKSADGATDYGTAVVYYANKVATLGFSLDLLRSSNGTGTAYDTANDTLRAGLAKQFVDYLLSTSVADWSQF